MKEKPQQSNKKKGMKARTGDNRDMEETGEEREKKGEVTK